MEQHGESLGPTEPWQIRAFPRELRKQIVEAAKRQRMTPGELATRVFLAARESDWGMDSRVPDSVPVAAPIRADDLPNLATAAATLATISTRGSRTAAHRIIKLITQRVSGELTIKPVQPPPRRRALAAPKR